MNSPRPGSSVYPFTPFPIERIRFADEPYLGTVRNMSNRDPEIDPGKQSHAITSGDHLTARFKHILNGRLGGGVVLCVRTCA